MVKRYIIAEPLSLDPSPIVTAIPRHLTDYSAPSQHGNSTHRPHQTSPSLSFSLLSSLPTLEPTLIRLSSLSFLFCLLSSSLNHCHRILPSNLPLVAFCFCAFQPPYHRTGALGGVCLAPTISAMWPQGVL